MTKYNREYIEHRCVHVPKNDQAQSKAVKWAAHMYADTKLILMHLMPCYFVLIKIYFNPLPLPSK